MHLIHTFYEYTYKTYVYKSGTIQKNSWLSQVSITEPYNNFQNSTILLYHIPPTLLYKVCKTYNVTSSWLSQRAHTYPWFTEITASYFCMLLHTAAQRYATSKRETILNRLTVLWGYRVYVEKEFIVLCAYTPWTKRTGCWYYNINWRYKNSEFNADIMNTI